ncbi:MAG: anti-sigma factor [Candidatus Manganitrophus sp. SB1]|nr:anti-sigma factor [Candidatus Manganitrophus morganii]
MDHSEIEGETQIGTFGDIDPLKATPGKATVEKKAKPAKTSRRSYQSVLISVLVVALAGFGGLSYFKLQEEIRGMHTVIQSLRTEAAAQEKTVAALTGEVKGREDSLQQARAEANQLKGQVESMRLALMERDGQISRLQQTAQFGAKLPKKTRELQSQLVQKQLENASLQNAMTNQTEWLRLLSSPTAELVRMTGSKEAGGAGGLLLFDPETQAAAFYGFELPKLPAGKIYQLWTIGEAPVSAGMFQPSKDRTAVMKVPKIINPKGLKAFSVTIEPAGGKAQPTGPAYLKGQFAEVSPS